MEALREFRVSTTALGEWHYKEAMMSDIIEGTALVSSTEIQGNPISLLGDIDITDFSEYLYEFSQGGKTVVDLNAHGVRHLAMMLHISIESTDVQETSDGKGWVVKAKAKNVRFGTCYESAVFQSKFYGAKRGDAEPRPDHQSLEKAMTRAQRNAIRGLIPTDMIKRLIQKAVAEGQAKQSAIIQAKDKCRTEMKRQKESLESHGISIAAVYEYTVQVKGDPETWAAEDWNELAAAVQDVRNSFLLDLVEGD